jgi:peptidyl-prolyl cis-trans isomerase SurA
MMLRTILLLGLVGASQPQALARGPLASQPQASARGPFASQPQASARGSFALQPQASARGPFALQPQASARGPFALQSAVVVDRMAVIVDKHVIKSSDIYRDLAATEFLNREQPSFSAEARHKAADRLIEQTIIRDEIANGGYRWASQADADALLNDIRRDRFAGSGAQLQAALARYGLTEEELRAQLLWQLTVLRFIDERFRTGVLITDDDVRTYYDQHLADLKREYPRDSGFESLKPKIRASLEGERINQNFVESIEAARKRVHVRYLQGAFE